MNSFWETIMVTALVLIIIIVFVVVFSVQNAVPVTLSFLVWHFQASLSIVVLVSLLSGIVFASLMISILRLRSAVKKR